MKTAILLAIAIILAACAVSQGAEPMIRPALNDPPQPETAGVRPYEMEGRTEDRAPLVDFEDLSGWTVECLDGADADLIRSREQQMWGRYVGKLVHKGTSAASRVILRPPAPIPTAAADSDPRSEGGFDCINAWIYSNTWEWAPEPGTPFLDVSILVKDSKGEERAVHLVRTRWKEWWLAHRKVDAAALAAGPLSFSGIEVRGMSNSEPRTIYLDSIYFYKENLRPLKYDSRPKRNLTPFKGQDQGLNIGPGTLPFPTREETILPMSFTEGANAVKEIADGVFEFSCVGKDCRVKYIWEPKTGALDEIAAYVNDVKVSRPMVGGGVMFGGGVQKGRAVEVGLSKDHVFGRFAQTTDKGEVIYVDYTLRIWGKSLVVDVIAASTGAEGFSLGEIHDVENPRLVTVPWITVGGGGNPKVLCSGKPESPIFTSVWVDWYRSNASSMFSKEWVQPDSAKINGGVTYSPKTDGNRNELYERIFLTVSPTFEEVLPTIANPVGENAHMAKDRLWQESWGPQDFEKEHERSRMLRSYGIDKLIQCNHEISWRDGGESFTLRTKAAPKKGGDEAQKKYVAAQKSLGWLSGLYTNYTDYAPVNEYWNEDHVQLTSEGEWRPAWPRCYALKPSRAVEWEAKLAPIIKQKFDSNTGYTDVHTAVSPWQYCDFDARVPGAGTFAATFYAYGELLLNDKKVYGGPIFSEGTYQWLYAGLADGNYGLCYGGPDPASEPLNVAFDLYQIHTKECDIGMPWTGGFLKSPGWNSPERIDASIDHFIAATMAYGHLGWLVEEGHGIERTCRSYYMLQQLQSRYGLRRPKKIEYADAQGKWLTASRAIATDVIKESRLHVLYENGLDLYVNGSEGNWVVRGKVLPPWGWYAVHGKDFEEYSALVDGRRIDWVKSPEYEFLDGRGVRTTHGGLSAKGSIAVRRSKSSVEVIDIYGNDWIGVQVKGRGTCTAFDPDGKSLGPAEARFTSDGMAWIKPVKGARSYRITVISRKPNPAFRITLDRATVVAGDKLSIRLSTTDARWQGREIVITAVGDQSGSAIEPHTFRLGSPSGDFAVSVTAPNTLTLGEILWVKIEAPWAAGSVDGEAWCALTVAPAFDVSVSRISGNRFALKWRNNTISRKNPSVRLLLKSADSRFGLEDEVTDGTEHTFTIVPPKEIKDANETLVAELAAGSIRMTREFPIKAVVDYPTVWAVDASTRFVTGLAFRGKAEVLGLGSGASFAYQSITSGGVTKTGIFSHPPYQGGVGYAYGISEPIDIPNMQCSFRCFIGIKDGGDVSDGVLFKVIAIDEAGKEHPLVEQLWAERKWKEISANLSAFQGKKIRLKFIADVGPKDNSSADWASWGEPRITTKQPLMRVEVGAK